MDQDSESNLMTYDTLQNFTRLLSRMKDFCEVVFIFLVLRYGKTDLGLILIAGLLNVDVLFEILILYLKYVIKTQRFASEAEMDDQFCPDRSVDFEWKRAFDLEYLIEKWPLQARFLSFIVGFISRVLLAYSINSILGL